MLLHSLYLYEGAALCTCGPLKEDEPPPRHDHVGGHKKTGGKGAVPNTEDVAGEWGGITSLIFARSQICTLRSSPAQTTVTETRKIFLTKSRTESQVL